MSKAELNCSVTRDLLPLYYDGAVSPETAEAIEAHLAGCPDCTRRLERLAKPLPDVELPTKEEVCQGAQKVLRSTRFDAFLTGAMIVFFAVLAALAAFWASHVIYTPVRLDNIDVRKVTVAESEDEDTSDVYFYNLIISGMDTRSCQLSTERQGSTLYITCKAPISARFGKKISQMYTEIGETDYDYSGEDADEHITEICLNGETIWLSQIDEAEHLAPEYVSVIADAIRKHPEANCFEINNEGLITAVDDGTIYQWGLEGTSVLVDDSYSAEDFGDHFSVSAWHGMIEVHNEDSGMSYSVSSGYNTSTGDKADDVSIADFSSTKTSFK